MTAIAIRTTDAAFIAKHKTTPDGRPIVTADAEPVIFAGAEMVSFRLTDIPCDYANANVLAPASWIVDV